MSQHCKTVLTISADMVGAYVSEILESSTINLSEEAPKEADSTLNELLKQYAKSKGIPIVVDEESGTFMIPGIYDVNGIKESDMAKVKGLEWDKMKRNATGGTYSYDGPDTFEKCILAIPSEVSRKIWGSEIKRPIYISVAIDTKTPVESTNKSRDPSGNVASEFKRKIKIGGYVDSRPPYYDNEEAYNHVIKDVLSGTGQAAMRSHWKKVISKRLADAQRDPAKLGEVLQQANFDANKTDNTIDVLSVSNTRISIKPGTSECDFLVKITSEYSWRPKNFEATQKVNPNVKSAPRITPNVGVAPRVNAPKSQPVVEQPVIDPRQKIRA